MPYYSGLIWNDPFSMWANFKHSIRNLTDFVFLEVLEYVLSDHVVKMHII